MDRIVLKYDTPIEVTKIQYDFIRAKGGGIFCHRKDEETGKYYVKIWLTKYRKFFEAYLNNEVELKPNEMKTENNDARIKELEVQIEKVYAELQAIDNDPNQTDISIDDFYVKREPFYKKLRKLDGDLRLLNVPEYDEMSLDEDDHIMTVKEFIAAVNDGLFIDSDGYGHYVKDNKRCKITVHPSDVPNYIRPDFDTIVWYNK